LEEFLLMIGKTLSHYQITSLIGKGGMGEVYQAKDQTLGRDVAIKVLPEEFAKDADRKARFQREAKLLASLNHPNIAAIYGLEESSGTNFLVLELVEGQTLADQIKQGPIPVEEALRLALQIAEALEAAHNKGVIHRDLKPANIKVTPDGKVKVLDFGLAKAFAGDKEEVNLSNSPTLSDAATQQGIILGTAAYMSPEQASGKSIDKRSDIWAFGVVLFEMLTGRSLFAGDNVSQTLARVLERQPDFSLLPSNLHPKVRELLKRCLQKDSKNRYHDIADIRLDLQEVLNDPGGVFTQPVSTAEPRTKLRTILPWIAAAIVLAAITGVAVWRMKPSEPKRVIRFTYELPEGQQLNMPLNLGLQAAGSPDGSRFVYGTTDGLYLRSMDALDAKLIAGTDKGSVEPFFSPDGQWIGYWSQTDRKLKKVAISGGAPVVICDTSPIVLFASWNSDNTIVYSDMLKGILQISADGGTAEVLIKGNLLNAVKEGFPITPRMLPDGKTLLFTNYTGPDPSNWQIGVQSLKSGERKILIRNGFGAVYFPTGHLVYGSANNTGNFLAVRFDLDRLEVKGGSVPVFEGIGSAGWGDSTAMIYVPQPTVAAGAASTASSANTLVWVNRQGKEEPLGAAPNQYGLPGISPDGTRVAVSIATGGNQYIWIWDIVRKTMTRLTFEEGGASCPLWTPDGKRIVYASTREGGLAGIYWKAADGTGGVTKLGSAPDRSLIPFSWSKDAKTLAVLEATPDPLKFEIGMLSMEGDHARKPLLQGKHDELFPKISPDGRWIAYSSNESGKQEVYVRPFPDVESGGRWQISTSGGDSPLWSPDGHELFYRQGDSFMAVAVEMAPTFKPGNPKLLFKGTYLSVDVPKEWIMWDIHPDGKRFLMIKPPALGGGQSKDQSRKINIVLNWFEELKQRMPTK
jgi:serine/threonine protein kinase/Tol biopolymer transport system component